jgi:hypothetical protein
MNMQVGQQVLSKPELERMVLSNLRMLPGSQHIEHVLVAERIGSRRNWAVIEIDPPLPTAADDAARNVISELRREFLMASSKGRLAEH